MPRIHKNAAGTVGIGLAVHRVEESDVVHVPSHVGKHRTNWLAAFSRSDKWPRTLHEIAVLALKGHQVFLSRHRFAVVLLQQRFVLPQIHVRGSARTKYLQDASRFGSMVREAATWLPCGGLVRCCGITEEVHQADAAESSVNTSKETSPRDFSEQVHDSTFVVAVRTCYAVGLRRSAVPLPGVRVAGLSPWSRTDPKAPRR